MKRSTKLIQLAVILTIVLAAVTIFSQQPTKKRRAPSPAGKLPDLVVKDIYLTPNCTVVVSLKNLGPGIVPDEVWTVHHPKSAGVYMYINGRKWGGASIWKFDPGRSLKAPGGTATYTSTLKVSGTAKITAIVDLWNEVKETNERNNKRIEKLICKAPPKKDLTIKIMRCPKVVIPGQNLDAGFQVVGKSTFPSSLKNIAVDIILTSKPKYPSPAPYATYSPNYSDGVLLKGGREHISFTGPGTVNVKLNGTNTIPADTPPGTYYLGAVIDAGNKVKEGNERNNVSFCKLKVELKKPKKPTITGYKEKCARKGKKITILGRNFGSRSGKGVALGGHGIHVDLMVISWSDTRIVATIPDDPRIKEGQWYYIGVEKADHTQWLSNINKNITICK